MGTPREALRTPAQSPSPEKETTRQGGAERNRFAGREIGFSLGGEGVKRGVAMGHDIL